MARGRKANGQFVKSGKKGGGRKGGGGSRTMRSRRGTGHTPLRVLETGGTLLAAYGAAALPGSDGGTTYNQGSVSAGVARARNVYSTANVKDVFLTTDPYWAPTRDSVGLGVIAAGVGKAYRHVHPGRSSVSRFASRLLKRPVRFA